MSKPVPKPWIDALPAGDPLREALLAARAEVPGRARLERVYDDVVAAGGGPGGAGPEGGGGSSGGGGEAAPPPLAAGAGKTVLAAGAAKTAAGSATLGTTASALGAAALGTSALGKFVGIALAGAASIATAVWIAGPTDPTGARDETEASAGVVADVRPAVDAAGPAPAPAAVTEPAPAVAKAGTSPAAPPPSTSAAAADPAGADDPDAEMALLREAQSAAASAPARALDLLDASERRFPRSALAQERAVIRVQALIAAGRRDEALTHARALLVAHPGTAHRPRLEQLLPELER